MARNLLNSEDRPLIPPTADQLAAKAVPLQVPWGDDPNARPAMAYPTLLELALYASQHKIPFDAARIEYAGCGTHGLELNWSNPS